MSDGKLVVEALPKQIDFLRAMQREVLYSGAYGAGKTWALCLKALRRAATPGAREGMCRKYLVSFKATTLRTLLESDGGRPPILPEGYYEHHKTDRIIRIAGGGEIVYFGLDNLEKIRSLSLTGCAIDQAEELCEDDWTALRGRVRMHSATLNRQIYAACNPGPPSHFLAHRFGIVGDKIDWRRFNLIMTKSTDNWFLPDDYIEDLNTYTGLAKSRYVEGKWVGSDRLVYDTWDASVFVAVRDEKEWKRRIVCCDEGYTNPSALTVLCEDGDGRVHQPYEWYHRRKLQEEVVAEAVHLRDVWRPEAYVCDPSAAGLIAALKDAGLPVVKADHKRREGVQVVRDHLVMAGDGRPRFTCDPSCVNTIREFGTWETKPDSDEFTKENDHTMDADRYGFMYLKGAGRRPRARVRIL